MSQFITLTRRGAAQSSQRILKQLFECVRRLAAAQLPPVFRSGPPPVFTSGHAARPAARFAARHAALSAARPAARAHSYTVYNWD